MTLIREIRSKMVRKIMAKADYRKKILKIDKFYFDSKIDDVESFYGLPLDSNGKVLPFVSMRGSTLRKLLNSIENGDIYGFIEYKGSRCKVRPKKIVK